jgi:hypothetical protein
MFLVTFYPQASDVRETRGLDPATVKSAVVIEDAILKACIYLL